MIFGWDISTSNVGVTVLGDGGNFVTADHIALAKLDTDLLLKAEFVRDWVRNFLCDHRDEHHCHIVEDKLGNFSAGGTMMQTLMKLAAFNTTVSYIVLQQSKTFLPIPGEVSIHHLHPSTVKSIMAKEGLIIPKGSDKKKLTLDYVLKTVPGFPVETNKNGNFKPFCFDRADAYITARAGFVRFFREPREKSQSA